MKTFNLVNPLTDKERLQVSRLLGHDLNGFLSAVYCSANICKREKDFSYLEKRVKPILIHIGQISSIISDLSLLDEFDLSSNVDDDYFSRESLKSSIERISMLNKTKLNCEISKKIPDKFLTVQDCLYGGLFNLIKNAIEHGKYDSNINVNVDFQDSYPNKTIFQPEGSANYNKFVGFHISNKGEGFSKNKNLQEYFTKCPRIKEKGFGLYFTGLVAKLLQAPVNIESQKGETKVSFFQPIYESN